MSADRAIFISYASQDNHAARRISNALSAAGLVVWFDQNELRGGDVWDASIRRQIKECALFVPIVSANTQEREEGYFRLEWRLAVDRSQLMVDDKAFFLPVIIDETKESEARVPEKFRERQWSRLTDEGALAKFVERTYEILHPQRVDATPAIASTSFPQRTDVRPSPTSVNRRPWIIGASLIVFAGIAAGGWLSTRHDAMIPANRATVVPYSAQDLRMSFAVLPLSAPDNDKAAIAFADEVTETLLKRLASFEPGRIVSRDSVEAALKKHASSREIGAALNVHFLLRGSVRRVGDAYNVTVSIIDTEADRVLGTSDFSWPVGKVLGMYSSQFFKAYGILTGMAFQVELAHTKSKRFEVLDARDLSYLANAAWSYDKKSYDVVMPLLRRALALAPNDKLALLLTIQVNLCECRNSWSADLELLEQEKIAAEAIERYLDHYPNNRLITMAKVNLYVLHGRFEDALVLVDRMLEQIPGDPYLLTAKALNYFKLGRLKEALALIDESLHEDSSARSMSLAAAIHFVLGQNAEAAELARKSAALMPLRVASEVRLIQVAAEANLGRVQRAKATFTDFIMTAPKVNNISSIKKWMGPHADLAGYEMFYEGLRKAGVPE